MIEKECRGTAGTQAGRPDYRMLPAGMQAAWRRLAGLPEGFVLYGGAALAMWLGHRAPGRLDFFAAGRRDLGRMARECPCLQGCEVESMSAHRMSVILPDSGGRARFAAGFPYHGRLASAPVPEGGGLVASIPDLFGRLCDAAQYGDGNDGEFLDIWALIDKGGVSLSDGLRFYMDIYRNRAVPLQTLAALAWQGRLDQPLPPDVSQGLRDAVKGVDVSRMA